jgi:hypothetical protein
MTNRVEKVDRQVIKCGDQQSHTCNQNRDQPFGFDGHGGLIEKPGRVGSKRINRYIFAPPSTPSPRPSGERGFDFERISTTSPPTPLAERGKMAAVSSGDLD